MVIQAQGLLRTAVRIPVEVQPDRVGQLRAREERGGER
jgi:hypothetical protein